MKKLIGAGVLVLVSLGTPALSQTATFVEKQGDWSVYAHNAAGKKVCFAVAKPRSTKPKNVRRGPIFFYVSDWPTDKVAQEISIKLGYPLKSTVPVEIKVAGSAFKLFTKDEGAYVEKTADEQKVVAAMKAGSTMVVQGRSTRGTLTTDEYSLAGISKALESVAKACQ